MRVRPPASRRGIERPRRRARSVCPASRSQVSGPRRPVPDGDDRRRWPLPAGRTLDAQATRRDHAGVAVELGARRPPRSMLQQRRSRSRIGRQGPTGATGGHQPGMRPSREVRMPAQPLMLDQARAPARARTFLPGTRAAAQAHGTSGRARCRRASMAVDVDGRARRTCCRSAAGGGR